MYKLIKFSPLIWLSGLSGVFYHFAILLHSLTKNTHPSKQKLNLVVILCFAVFFLQIVAILKYVVFNDIELVRVFGVFYNASFWIMGGAIIYLVANSERKEIELIQHSILTLTWLVIVAGVLVIFLSYNDGCVEMNFPSILQLVAGNSIEAINSTLFTDSTQVKLHTFEWAFNQCNPRLNILSPYPNALAGLLLLLIPQIIFRKIQYKYTMLILSLLILYFSFSRTAIFSLLMGLCFTVLIVRYRGKVIKLPILMFLLVVALGYILLSTSLIETLLITHREGSFIVRSTLYIESLQLAFRPENIFLGYGVKPLSFYGVPLGSHSTYLSYFLRVGILGPFIIILLILLTFNCARKNGIFFQTIKTGNKYQAENLSAFASVASMAFFMCFEDIDAPALMSFIFFLEIGVIYFFGNSRAEEIGKLRER